MPPKMHCPACGGDMRSRSLLSHYSLKPYRVCPDCKSKYTSDSKSKQRQVPILILVLIALGLTVVARLHGPAWLFPAVASYITLLVYLGFALSRVTYVEYTDPDR